MQLILTYLTWCSYSLSLINTVNLLDASNLINNVLHEFECNCL